MALTLQNDYDAIRDAILAWLQTYSGLPANRVIWVNEEISKLTKPFGTLYEFDGDSEYGLPILNDYLDSADLQRKTQYLAFKPIRVQAEIYSVPINVTTVGGKEALHYLRQAVACLRTADVQQLFAGVGIALLRHHEIKRVDEIFGNRWERRAIVDLEFNYQQNLKDDGINSTNTVETAQFYGVGVPIGATVGVPKNIRLGQYKFNNKMNAQMVTLI